MNNTCPPEISSGVPINPTHTGSDQLELSGIETCPSPRTLKSTSKVSGSWTTLRSKPFETVPKRCRRAIHECEGCLAPLEQSYCIADVTTSWRAIVRRMIGRRIKAAKFPAIERISTRLSRAIGAALGRDRFADLVPGDP